MAGGTSTCATNMVKLCIPSRSACHTAMALAGAVVSNPTAKNTTSREGFNRARFNASSGEYTILDVSARGLGLQQALGRSGNAQHVTKRTKHHFGPHRKGNGAINISSGVTHTGHPGPCMSEIFEATVPEASLDNRVRLPATHFHQGPWPSGAADRLRHLSNGITVAVFVEESHVAITFSSSS